MGAQFARQRVRTGGMRVDNEAMSAKRRQELAESKGFNSDRFEDASELGSAVIKFLREQGHVVTVNESKYTRVYRESKDRDNMRPEHQDKTAAHIHRRALRAMIKRFLVDLYTEWRRAEGLPVASEYSEGKLGKVHGQAASNTDWASGANRNVA